MSSLSERANSLKSIIGASAKLTDPNEASTRVVLIDQILERVLGWPRTEFNPETYSGAPESLGKTKAWLDYHLGSAGTPRLVVEAKRRGNTFVLGPRKQRNVGLEQLRNNHGKELQITISQALTYCRRMGTLSFVVTNGHQWVASQAVVPGLPESQIQAVVFHDLEDVSENLREFVDLLSPAGLSHLNLLARAGGPGSPAPTYAKSLNGVLFSGAVRPTNYLSAPLRVLMRDCFGEMTEVEQLQDLVNCYVPTDTNDQSLRLLESFAGRELPDAVPYDAERIKRDAHLAPFYTREDVRGTSVLVVGRAGSGKSTFLAMTRYRLASLASRGHVLLFVDLLSRTETHAHQFDHDRVVADICTDLLEELRRAFPAHDPYLRANLEAMFAGEIDKLRDRQREGQKLGESFDAKVDQLIERHVEVPNGHLRAAVGWLVRAGSQVTILLDNVDRGTPEFEQVTSKLAEQLAAKTKATVVTCLRDTTYASGKFGFLDTRKQTVFTIAPPPFVDVARKRFAAAKSKLSTDERFRKRMLAAAAGTPLERVTDFADIIAEAILEPDGKVGEAITALSGTNIRTALQLLEDFCVSPHTDPNALFTEYQRASSNRKRSLDVDVFLRSVMRGDSQRYAEKDSRIINLFHAPVGRVASHLVSVRILQHLEHASRGVGDTLDVRVADLLARLGALGHSSKQVSERMNKLGQLGLINSLTRPETRPDAPWGDEDTVRIGVSGRYYLQVLLHNREYQNLVVDDTIVYDELVLRALEHAHTDSTLSGARKNERKVRALFAYLGRRERAEASPVFASAAHGFELVVERLGVARFGTGFRADLTH